MLTEAIILKTLEATTEAVAGEAALVKAKSLLARFDNDAQFHAAVEADRERILEGILAVVVGVARAITGRQLGSAQAMEALHAMACDPAKTRRVRALLNESAASTDERIAMLATGYLVGGQEPSLRERLDWAMRGLFPADAGALATLIECQNRIGGTVLLAALEHEDRRATWDVNEPGYGNGTPVASDSLRALASGHCIELGPAQDVRDSVGLRIVRRDHSVRVLPLGHELHAALSTVDWREIAKRRATEPGRDA